MQADYFNTSIEEEPPVMVMAFTGSKDHGELTSLSKHLVFDTDETVDSHFPKVLRYLREFLTIMGFSKNLVERFFPESAIATLDPKILQQEFIHGPDHEEKDRAIVTLTNQGEDFSVIYTKDNHSIELKKDYFDLIHEADSGVVSNE